MTNPATIAAGLNKAERRAYLMASPKRRAVDPASLFVSATRGCRHPLPGTIIVYAGLMLTSEGRAIRAILQEQSDD